MTGPSPVTSTLYSDRSPWMMPAQSIRTHLPEHGVVVFERQRLRQRHIVESRCGVAVGVDQKLHQHHARAKNAWGRGTRTPAAARRYSASTSTLCQASSCALRPKPRALGHRARLARILGLASLLVQRGLAEAALVRLPCRPSRSGHRRRSGPRRPWPPCRSSAAGSLRRQAPRGRAAGVASESSIAVRRQAPDVERRPLRGNGGSILAVPHIGQQTVEFPS